MTATAAPDDCPLNTSESRLLLAEVPLDDEGGAPRIDSAVAALAWADATLGLVAEPAPGLGADPAAELAAEPGAAPTGARDPVS